jgi:hypothetical protein
MSGAGRPPRGIAQCAARKAAAIARAAPRCAPVALGPIAAAVQEQTARAHAEVETLLRRSALGREDTKRHGPNWRADWTGLTPPHLHGDLFVCVLMACLFFVCLCALCFGDSLRAEVLTAALEQQQQQVHSCNRPQR